MPEKKIHDRTSFNDQGAHFLKSNTTRTEYDYAANRPPLSKALAGKTITIDVAEVPLRVKHLFSEKEVRWEILQGPGKGDTAAVPYEAFELAPQVFFISFLAREKESIAMAVDLAKGAATLVQGLITEKGIQSNRLSAHIEEVGSRSAFHPAFSLGGTRFMNVYADNVAYEHIYLTRVYGTWLGVRGPQAGQADTEEYHAYKVADGLYFLYWNEKILTTQMSFLFNFFKGCCVGQVFGIVEDTRVHNTIGAETKLIHTHLPEIENYPRLDIFTGE